MPKRVFISYSHDSAAHAERVLALADQLRADGVDTHVDQYNPSPQLTITDYIVVVCTPNYRRRFEGTETPDTGKLILVLFENAEYEDIPVTLRSLMHYRLPVGYGDLYRHITGQPKTPAAPLGKAWAMPSAARRGQHIDNRGATIGQQIIAKGTMNLGIITPVSHRSVERAILLFTANATHPGDRLQIEEELRAILDALARSRARDRYDPRISPAVTFAKVVHDLDDHDPAIVHFSGHGDPDGNIILLDGRGDETHVTPHTIAELFANLRHTPELVVFATCNSTMMAEATAAHVCHAIGFTDEVTDSTARSFSAALYERLASRAELDVPRAFNLARLTSLGSGYADADRARLFSRGRTSLWK